MNPCRDLSADALAFTLDEAEKLVAAWHALVPDLALDGDSVALAHSLAHGNLGRFVEGIKAAVRRARMTRSPLDPDRLRIGFADLMPYERYAG